MKTHTSSIVLAAFAIVAVGSGCVADEDGLTLGTKESESQLLYAQYKASHNSYDSNNGNSDWPGVSNPSIVTNFDEGMYHIEIDIRDNMAYLQWPNPQTVPSGWSTTLEGNWWVAHLSTEHVTEYCGTVGRLNDCLNYIRTWHNDSNNSGHPLITLWIDKKQDWECDMGCEDTSWRSPWRLDDMISNKFDDDDLFRPVDMKDTYGTLREAAEDWAWPTQQDLEDKVMIILTSDADCSGNNRLEAYVDDRGQYAKAFVAVSAYDDADLIDCWETEPDLPACFDSEATDWVGMYNFEWVDDNRDGGCDSGEACQYVGDANWCGYLTRTWDLDDADEYDAALDEDTNFLAVDEPWDSMWP